MRVYSVAVYEHLCARMCVCSRACFRVFWSWPGPRQSCHNKQTFPIFSLPEGEKHLTCSPLNQSLHSYRALQLWTDEASLASFWINKYWEKFSISNNRASDKPHWLRYCHCAKLTLAYVFKAPCRAVHHT